MNGNRRGPLIVGLGGGALIILLVVGLVVPKAGDVKTRQGELERARQQETALTLKLDQLKAAVEEAPKDRRRLRTLEAGVPAMADLPGLIRSVNEAAADSDVDFMSVSPSSPSTPSGAPVSIIPTQVIVVGRYFAISDFLRRLETLDRISKVTTAAVNGGPDGLPQLQVSMTAEFYTTDLSTGPGSVPGHTKTPPGVAAPATAGSTETSGGTASTGSTGTGA